jgi:hypothetical protein
MCESEEFRKGYGQGINYNHIFDVMSPTELIQYAKIYAAAENDFANGLAQYCLDVAKR